MAEPTIETLLDLMHDELARLRDKAIAINLVCADLLRRGYYVYRQEMPDELYHLLAIKDDDAAISRIRVLTHPPVHGLDDLLPGEIVAVVFAGKITYTPDLPESNAAPTPQPEAEPMASPGD
jgi:hypothetical protein